jgi:hypothetical protein
MIRLLALGDGVRDAAMTPALVERLVGTRFEWRFEPWRRLHGKGYENKLLFALVQARDDDRAGVVATVDRDNSSSDERLRELQRGRERDRTDRPSLPAALGCADPHAEAWLLDDAVAVREVLDLPSTTAVPNVRKVSYPKQELDRLHAGSARSREQPRTICAEIASRLDPSRCAHADATGLSAFVKDVQSELGPLAASRPRG